MIFATGSTFSQGTPTPDWMAPVMGGVIGLAIIVGIVAAIFGIKAHIQENDVRRSLGPPFLRFLRLRQEPLSAQLRAHPAPLWGFGRLPFPL